LHCTILPLGLNAFVPNNNNNDDNDDDDNNNNNNNNIPGNHDVRELQKIAILGTTIITTE
jgi:hypothetical protein